MGLRAPIPGLLGWLPKDASYWLCVLLFGKQLHTYTSSLTRRHIPSVLSSFPHLLLSYAISLRITWDVPTQAETLAWVGANFDGHPLAVSHVGSHSGRIRPCDCYHRHTSTHYQHSPYTCPNT